MKRRQVMQPSNNARYLLFSLHLLEGEILNGIMSSMNKKRTIKFGLSGLLTALVLFVGGCQRTTAIKLPDSVNTPIPATATLQPSSTPTITATATLAKTATALPSPTSTPRSHQIKLGETMGGIAWQYGVPLDALIALNPDINPYAMKVGETVLIPAETLTPANQTPVPTTIAMPVDSLTCTRMPDDGVRCFAWVQNTLDTALENVSISVNIADLEASQVFARQADAPLNVLLPGDKMPFTVYFPPEIPQPFQFSAQLSSAIPLDDPTGRYQPLNLNDVVIDISKEADMATVSGSFTTESPVSSVRIAAAAVNSAGEIIGLRIWQSDGAGIEDQTAFELQVYAVSGSIDQVLIFSEAIN